MEFGVLFYLSVLFFSGLFFGRMAKHCKLPNVTGYLVGGLIMGPSVLGIVPEDVISSMSIVSSMALGFIAFSIGGEFKMSFFRRVGFTPIVIAIFEAVTAVVLVVIGLVVVGYSLPFSLVLGAIAAATAPAATVMVVKQYKAKGPVTETLLSVVALDDAVALISFGFSVAVAKSLTDSSASGSLLLSILEPLGEIGLSVVIGGVLGILFTIPLRYFKKESNRMSIIIGFVFMAIALSDILGASSLLTCMVLGAVLVNVSNASEHIFKIADSMTPPLFMLFFVLSGAELNLSVIPTIGVVGVTYVVLRVIGKMLGATVGAKLMKAPDTVCKYLGPTLMPQAGVAIGLSLVAESVVPEYASVIRAVVLCGTLIYEMVGPAVAKVCLQKAGEITV